MKFLEVQLKENTTSLTGDPRVEIWLPNGRSLLVGQGFNVEQVRALLALVEAGSSGCTVIEYSFGNTP